MVSTEKRSGEEEEAETSKLEIKVTKKAEDRSFRRAARSSCTLSSNTSASLCLGWRECGDRHVGQMSRRHITTQNDSDIGGGYRIDAEPEQASRVWARPGWFTTAPPSANQTCSSTESHQGRERDIDQQTEPTKHKRHKPWNEKGGGAGHRCL